jgi:hypothetical protein
MSLCNNPYSIPEINIDEYIGTSLNTINSNFSELKTELCRLNDEYNILTPNLNNLQTSLNTLSSNVNGFAKAWVNFEGGGSGFLNLISYHNVLTVSGNNLGSYDIRFLTPLSNNNYALIGTCSHNQTNNLYTWVQTTTGFTSASATINIRNTTGALVTADTVSVVVFGT